ncbi:ER degradation-enhancing alpha-mannosidase-like protein 3 [Dermacentor silvarum]|uniref:ER degradation-enhancing alpha-mannosidase-like protein 3 n=1 Tax=Dermacentor silvarum TaxID=543639 RepID=UPI001898E12D|nr:ER degradation-enhancing alpha-mannosidase-like protein 3 [Dermacentor silvarum]
MASFHITVVAIAGILMCIVGTTTEAVTTEERVQLREQVKEMFYHAYRAYMDNAYPADELMPLSCKGRYRGTEANRGDIDDALGNFSLTLVDTMDTLMLLGDMEEFERAVKLVIRDVSFDSDIVVSVFETNIRMVGGLLSGHILASYLQERHGLMTWYRGDLLLMAKELGYRLLPAFNTTTGVPHPRINLRLGLKSPKLGQVHETCTACAGTMILEFAALSRLTGEPVFEAKARAAMDYLWQQRHRSSDLMGTVLNIHNGDWIRRDSGVGAGIDSYYEYCLKAYILLGDDLYLERFNKHYTAVMKYVSQGPMLVDVHMHRPNTNSRNFMDALLAFWPGLQVLKGDIKPAIETHEMLYQVMQLHNFLPEAFTTDFQVHWGQHPLRPEFVESTYFLFKATGDPYYLEAGRRVVESLQKHARVLCGFAAVKDVRTGTHEDRMDSFVLAETLKYLYLLFASPEDLPLDLDHFVFTTEAHLLPLSLARINRTHFDMMQSPRMMFYAPEEEFSHSCPNTHFLFPKSNYAHTVRQPLKNLVEGACPTVASSTRRLHASQFEANKKEHLNLVKKMGVFVTLMSDGRIQLIHNAAQAESPEDAQEGLLFMQEMIELAKQQNQQEQHVRSVTFTLPSTKMHMVLQAGPAQFGKDLGKPANEVRAPLVLLDPLRGCGELHNSHELKGKIVIMERGECMFVEKARKIQAFGAVGGIVLDNQAGTNARQSPVFAMSGDGTDDVTIPLVFLFTEDGQLLLNAFKEHPNLVVTLSDLSIISSSSSNTEGEPAEEAANQTSGEAKKSKKASTAMPTEGGPSSAEAELLRKVQILRRLDALGRLHGETNELLEKEATIRRMLGKLLSQHKLFEMDIRSLLERLEDFTAEAKTKHSSADGLCTSPLVPATSSVNPLSSAEAFVAFIMLHHCEYTTEASR